MTLRVFREGFNFSQDGPGNRLVYHLQGCNMRCPWCSNPEGIAADGTLMVNPDLLVDAVCPHGAIRDRRLDRDRCGGCAGRECLHERRNLGVRLSCQTLELPAMVAQAGRSAGLFLGGGGVTLSGGEPTLQFPEVQALLGRLKQAGIPTAMETNATHLRLPELFPLIDFLIMDYKHWDDRTLAAATGVGSGVINANMVRAFAGRDQLLVRIPLIHGFNDAPEDLDRFIGFFGGFDTGRAAFEFLPFHEYGKSKWAQCGMPYPAGPGAIGPGTLLRFQAAFRASQMKVVTT